MYIYYTNQNQLKDYRKGKTYSNINQYLNWIIKKAPENLISKNITQQIKLNYYTIKKYPTNALPFRFYCANTELDNYLKNYTLIVKWQI